MFIISIIRVDLLHCGGYTVLMKTFLLSFILLLSISSYADCYEALLDGQMDSSHFKIWSGDVLSNSSESMDAQMAANAINKIYEELGCNLAEVKVDKIKCSDELTPWSQMCRVDTISGYFIVIKDYVDSVNVIFNRWD